jgi:hypothetical protein
MGWKSDVTDVLSLHSYPRSAMIPSALEAMGQHGSLRPTHEPKRTSSWATFMLLASLMFMPALLPLQSLAQSN